MLSVMQIAVLVQSEMILSDLVFIVSIPSSLHPPPPYLPLPPPPPLDIDYMSFLFYFCSHPTSSASAAEILAVLFF